MSNYAAEKKGKNLAEKTLKMGHLFVVVVFFFKWLFNIYLGMGVYFEEEENKRLNGKAG